jgi:hypothetical protein
LKTSRLLFLFLFVLLAVMSAPAAPINVIYQGSVIEGFPGFDAGLPIPLCSCLNNVRFRFFVPDYASLVSINSINVSVDVFNEFATGFEQGSLLFVLNGAGFPNVTLNSFNDLTGTDFSNPLQVPGSVGPGDMANALLEIQGDGVFFIRVNRRGNNAQGNDFWVDNPQAAIDGELAAVPEPSTVSLIGGGLAAAIVLKRRRSRN